MIEGTFADWLVNRGFRFHPDTVIVDATTWYHHIVRIANDKPSVASKITRELFNQTSKPVFDHMVIEMGGQWACYLINDTGADVPIYTGIVFTASASGVDGISHGNAFSINFDKDGKPLLPINHPDYVMMEFAENNILPPVLSSRIDDDLVSIGLCVLCPLALMHQKNPVELVTYKRQKRRYIARKTGKEPSPYFRLINVGGVDRRIQYSDPLPPVKRNLPVHAVRGHIRHVEDHPLEQFNGTFFIPPHTRGQAKNGHIDKRAYKIVLRDTDQHIKRILP